MNPDLVAALDRFDAARARLLGMLLEQLPVVLADAYPQVDGLIVRADFSHGGLHGHVAGLLSGEVLVVDAPGWHEQVGEWARVVDDLVFAHPRLAPGYAGDPPATVIRFNQAP